MFLEWMYISFHFQTEICNNATKSELTFFFTFVIFFTVFKFFRQLLYRCSIQVKAHNRHREEETHGTGHGRDGNRNNQGNVQMGAINLGGGGGGLTPGGGGGGLT